MCFSSDPCHWARPFVIRVERLEVYPSEIVNFFHVIVELYTIISDRIFLVPEAVLDPIGANLTGDTTHRA